MRIFFRNNKILDTLLIVVLFFVSFVYFKYGYQYFDLRTYHYDEGIVMYGALRILNGDIPYGDFWTLYFPGQFYLLAMIFKIFGISIKVARLSTILVLSLTVCGIYLFIHKLSSRLLGLLAFLVSLAWLKSYMIYNRPGQVAILVYILCCFPLLTFIKSGQNKWLVITGILLGLIGLFRQDFGFYIFISIFLIIALRQINYSMEKILPERIGLILKDGSFLFIGFIIIFLPLFIYFIFNSAFREFINDAITFPIIVYPKVRDLPFPPLRLSTIIFYLPLFVFLFACIKLLFYNWRIKIENAIPWFMLFFLFSGLGLFNYTNVRVCPSHLLPTMIPAIMLFILLLNDFLNKYGQKITVYKNIILIIPFLGLCILLSYTVSQNFTRLKSLFNNKLQNRLDILRAQGFYDDSELAQSQALAIKYIQSRTGQSEKIFVGNLRHDKVVNSDMMFYFLSERHSATKYYELHPGLTNTQRIQDNIINELRKANVRYIVLWSGSEGINEPNESNRSSGITDLDNFIQKNYGVEKNFGYYVILKRI